MGLELCRLVSLAMQSRLSKILGRAAAVALWPVTLTRWSDKLWSSTQWDSGWLQGRPRARAGLWGTQVHAPNPGCCARVCWLFITALIGAEKVQQSSLDRPSFFSHHPHPPGQSDYLCCSETNCHPLLYSYQGHTVQPRPPRLNIIFLLVVAHCALYPTTARLTSAESHTLLAPPATLHSLRSIAPALNAPILLLTFPFNNSLKKKWPTQSPKLRRPSPRCLPPSQRQPQTPLPLSRPPKTSLSRLIRPRRLRRPRKMETLLWRTVLSRRTMTPMLTRPERTAATTTATSANLTLRFCLSQMTLT